MLSNVTKHLTKKNLIVAGTTFVVATVTAIVTNNVVPEKVVIVASV